MQCYLDHSGSKQIRDFEMEFPDPARIYANEHISVNK